MIIDILNTDLELDLEPSGYILLREKGEDGYYARFKFNQGELLAVANAFVKAATAYAEGRAVGDNA